MAFRHAFLGILLAALAAAAFTPDTALAGSDPIQCFKKATQGDLKLNSVQAAELCAAAVSDMPLYCYQAAVSDADLDLTPSTAAALCSTAHSLAPVSCAKTIKALRVLREYNLPNLCSGATEESIESTVSCFREAHAKAGLDLAQSLAVTLCGRGKRGDW